MDCLNSLDLPRRAADYGRIWFDGMNHHCISANHRVIADLNRPEDHAAYTEDDVVPNLGPPRRIKLHVKLFRAHIHPLEEGYISADPSCSDNTSRWMGDEEAWANFAPWQIGRAHV